MARVWDSSDSVAHWYRVKNNKVVDTIGPRPASDLESDVTTLFGSRAPYAHINWWTSRSAAGYMWNGCVNSEAPRGSAPPRPTEESDSRETVIRMVFGSCLGCTVHARQAPYDAPDRVRTWEAPVRGGVAILRVPTGATAGMAFEVTSEPWFGAWPGGNAVPVVAIGFEGVSAGSRVGKDVAMREGQRANWCWAGTDRRRVTIRVRSVRDTFPTEHSDESPRQAAYWAAPTLRTLNDSMNMQTGMGTQDVAYCS